MTLTAELCVRPRKAVQSVPCIEQSLWSVVVTRVLGRGRLGGRRVLSEVVT